MEKILDTEFGKVEIRDVMIDIDGRNLEEGISVISIDDTFDNFDLVGWSIDSFENYDSDDIRHFELLIELNGF